MTFHIIHTKIICDNISVPEIVARLKITPLQPGVTSVVTQHVHNMNIDFFWENRKWINRKIFGIQLGWTQDITPTIKPFGPLAEEQKNSYISSIVYRLQSKLIGLESQLDPRIFPWIDFLLSQQKYQYSCWLLPLTVNIIKPLNVCTYIHIHIYHECSSTLYVCVCRGHSFFKWLPHYSQIRKIVPSC